MQRILWGEEERERGEGSKRKRQGNGDRYGKREMLEIGGEDKTLEPISL